MTRATRYSFRPVLSCDFGRGPEGAGASMRRRKSICLVGVLVGVTAGPLAAQAQQSGKVYRIAWVAPSEPVDVLNESSGHRGYRALIEELRRLGYFEGQNLTFERYSGGGRSERYGQLAND